MSKNNSSSLIENSNNLSIIKENIINKNNNNDSNSQSFVSFKKLQNKKRIISEKFSIIIYNKNRNFFKERSFTKEKLIEYVKEIISFENLSNYNYNKLLKRLEEKVIEKVKPHKLTTTKIFFNEDSIKLLDITLNKKNKSTTDIKNKTSLGIWLKARHHSTGIFKL